MRGDRPAIDSSKMADNAATPHARGSTRQEPGRTAAVCGYPACAGIDPCPDIARTHPGWLPRMRGDRPGAISFHISENKATPHARGSTWHI